MFLNLRAICLTAYHVCLPRNTCIPVGWHTGTSSPRTYFWMDLVSIVGEDTQCTYNTWYIVVYKVGIICRTKLHLQLITKI